jgi:hypothetical protein
MARPQRRCRPLRAVRAEAGRRGPPRRKIERCGVSVPGT